MSTDIKVLDLLYRQIPPEKILSALKENLGNTPESFLRPANPNGDPSDFLRLQSYPVLDRTFFLDFAEITLKGYSEDEHLLLHERIRQKTALWKKDGHDESCSFLAPLIDVAMDHLTIAGGMPVCKEGHVLGWRDAYLRLGQDLLVCAMFALLDHKDDVQRYDFTWPVILRVDNRDLYKMLEKGMAENHNHLAGGTQSFQVTWCRMMNYPSVIRDELVNFRKSNLYAKMHRGEKVKVLDKFDVLELAALIRTILFRALHREEFSGTLPSEGLFTEETISGEVVSRAAFSKETISEKAFTEETVSRETKSGVAFDGKEAFRNEYVNAFSMQNQLADQTDCLRSFYGVRIHVLDDPEYCLDYALEDKYARTALQTDIRLVAGERSFLYRCMRACLEKGRLTDFEQELFYLYIVLQCNFRSEMIQNNNQTGFMNFKNYQDRKDDAWDLTPYFCDAVGMALNNRLYAEPIRSLEGRVVPKPNPKDNINKVFRYDIAKRFRDCTTDKIWEKKNYLFTPELDTDLFQCAEWFYIFHFFKTTDDRKLNPDAFTLPVCRHEKHRSLVKRQAVGFAEALRISPYFRTRVRAIDAASDEFLCRPEVFALAYRYIDGVQRKWNAGDDGLLPSSPIRISKTYHAGEDFLDIAGGLRAIDEAIFFLHMGPDSRIGHALALGVDPEVHYRTKHWEIVTTRQERLDDIVWILFRSRELGVPIGDVQQSLLRSEARTLLHYIYGDSIRMNRWSDDLRNYWRCMKLRGDDPSVYCTGSFSRPGLSADELTSYLVDDTFEDPVRSELNHDREDPQISGMYYLYHYGIREGLHGDETYTYSVENEYIKLMRDIQDAMMAELERKNIIIESNPSSNVLIGTFKDYRLHPVFRFNNRMLTQMDGHKKTTKESNIQMRVCINTDDLGVFDTSLEYEYALLYEALRSNRLSGHAQYSESNILDYLNDLREMGLHAVFPANM